MARVHGLAWPWLGRAGEIPNAPTTGQTQWLLWENPVVVAPDASCNRGASAHVAWAWSDQKMWLFPHPS